VPNNEDGAQRGARLPTPLGAIEPHAGLLTAPSPGQLLYKVMTIENLLRALEGCYLHFNRVDSYVDFPGADPHDGEQLPVDLVGNAGAKFIKAPEFSAANYYDRSRARTYTCCFSLQNSEYIWSNYANDSAYGKVALLFDYTKLRARLNESLDPANSRLLCNGVVCHQIFSVNYGIVEYVDWDQHQANATTLPNPIRYTYLKAKRFSEERELRISLSAIGIGEFVLNDGTTIEFPPTLSVPFDFRAAIVDGTICHLLRARNANPSYLRAALLKMNVELAAIDDSVG